MNSHTLGSDVQHWRQLQEAVHCLLPQHNLQPTTHSTADHGQDSDSKPEREGEDEQQDFEQREEEGKQAEAYTPDTDHSGESEKHKHASTVREKVSREVKEKVSREVDSPNLSYAEPHWSGVPSDPFFLTVIKNGRVIQEVDISCKAFQV